MPTSKLAKRGWFILFLAIAAFYFYGLGFLPLMGPDEPRYAQIAREMYARGDFITPTLGGTPWFEKPPLLYWLMIASYRVFGVGEVAARFGPALCGLATGFFVWWIARTVAVTEKSRENDSDFPRWSALVFLTSLGAIVFSRAASFDIVLTMTLNGALACFFVWHIKSKFSELKLKNQRVLLAGFYFFIGLSLLAKGLIGVVIAFAVIGAYFFVRREWPSRVLVKSLWWGIPVVLTVAGAWYGAMLYRHGGLFFNQFIVQHHFARFLTNRYHHPQPVYFYLPIFALFSLPWTFFLAGTVASMRFRDLREDSSRSRLRQFSMIVIVAVVLPFSLSGSKLPAYILPALPAAALLIADRLTVFIREHRGDNLIRLTGALFVLAAGAAFWTSAGMVWLPKGCLVAGVSSLALVGLFALIFPRRRTAAFQMFAGCALLAALIALHCSGPVAAPESVRELMRLASAEGHGNMPVVGLHTVERTAEFYAAGSLVYGSDGEPVKFEGAADVVESARRAGGSILCFVPIDYAFQLTNYAGAQTEIIGTNGQVSLVLVRAR